MGKNPRLFSLSSSRRAQHWLALEQRVCFLCFMLNDGPRCRQLYISSEGVELILEDVWSGKAQVWKIEKRTIGLYDSAILLILQLTWALQFVLIKPIVSHQWVLHVGITMFKPIQSSFHLKHSLMTSIEVISQSYFMELISLGRQQINST